MGRRPRVHFSGAIYHVYDRGVDRREIYIDDADRRKFLEKLEQVRAECGARVLAYCLMGNHFHLVVQVAGIRLSEIMHRVLTSYAAYFNERHDRTGHLFEGRHGAKPCSTDAYLQRLIRYIHQNPVRAELVSKARDWPWSSVHGFEDDGSGDDFEAFDPWGAESESVSMLRLDEKSVPDLPCLAARAGEASGVPVDVLRSSSRLRWIVAARRRFIADAVAAGHSLTSIAGWLRTSRSSMTRHLAKISSCSKAERPSSPVRPAESD